MCELVSEREDLSWLYASLNCVISFRLIPSALLITMGLSIGAYGSVSSEGPSRGSAPSTPAADGTRVSCASEGSGWPISDMDGGIDSRHDMHELTAALQAFVNEPRMMAPAILQSSPIEDAPWFVLAESDRSVTIATGQWNANGPVKDGGLLTFDRTDTGWTPAGYQDCRASSLRPELASGLSWVEMRASGELDRVSTQPVVYLSEFRCSSARDPRPFLREPAIVETDDSVTITWTSQASAGGTCGSREPVPQQIDLTKPLGDRVLLDGSHWPARPILGDS